MWPPATRGPCGDNDIAAWPGGLKNEAADQLGESLDNEGRSRGSSSSTALAGGGQYEADKEDLLDQHVGYYLRHHPEVHARHTVRRKRPGAYELDGREVQVEWQYATEPNGQGFLVVVDGPLRQPFGDYMEMGDANAEYDPHGRGRSSLHQIPRDQRMSFHDQHKVYTRLEAMKVAKEQAFTREKHADYIVDGREVPDDLMHKYKKTIQQKLGQPRRSQQRAEEAHGAQLPSDPITDQLAQCSEPTPPPPALYSGDTGDTTLPMFPSSLPPPPETPAMQHSHYPDAHYPDAHYPDAHYQSLPPWPPPPPPAPPPHAPPLQLTPPNLFAGLGQWPVGSQTNLASQSNLGYAANPGYYGARW